MMCIQLCVYNYVYIYVYIYMCIYICVNIYICTYICIHTCVCIYIYVDILDICGYCYTIYNHTLWSITTTLPFPRFAAGQVRDFLHGSPDIPAVEPVELPWSYPPAVHILGWDIGSVRGLNLVWQKDTERRKNDPRNQWKLFFLLKFPSTNIYSLTYMCAQI